jgi:death on curing protein
MTEPRWISRQALVFLHSESLAAHGGAGGLRDEGLLDSALARPRNRFLYEPEADLPGLAASYGFGLAKNHPFVDGNKRAAFHAVGLFLAINGLRLTADQVDAIHTIMKLAASQLSEEELAAWIRVHSAPRP